MTPKSVPAKNHSGRPRFGQDPAAALLVLAFLPGWFVVAKLCGLYDRDHRSLRHLTSGELPFLLVWAVAGSAILACQSDDRLVELVRNGHERAFDAIVDRYRRPLVRFAAGMRLLNCGHAHRMNRKHGRTGHLFRNHYTWQPVESDEHLLEAIRYILLNPVRAGICETPEDWRWSSYRVTADLDLPPNFLALSDLLAIFGPTPTKARAAFLDLFK